MQGTKKSCYSQTRNRWHKTAPRLLHMKIAPVKRVSYKTNPLAEVVWQLRWSSPLEIRGPVLDAFAGMLERFPHVVEENSYDVQVRVEESGGASAERRDAPPTFRLRSDAHSEVISIASDFVAVTCSKYECWENFVGVIFEAWHALARITTIDKPVRIGLRYKNVIERESIGLEGSHWYELIQPFLLGPLAPNALMDGQAATSSDASSHFTQSTLVLDEINVLLQGALMKSVEGDRYAFLIDADFFAAEAIASSVRSDDELKAVLERLHENSGPLFRRSITERLHNALGPT